MSKHKEVHKEENVYHGKEKKIDGGSKDFHKWRGEANKPLPSTAKCIPRGVEKRGAKIKTLVGWWKKKKKNSLREGGIVKYLTSAPPPYLD